VSSPSHIGRFVVVRRIGSGGIGTVYEALDPEIERRVAIKLLRREMVAENPELVERLFNEARAANRIGHPGVVQVSEFGRLEDETAYLVMELLDGVTLRQRMRAHGGPLPMDHSLHIVIQLADALDAGHRRGVIHRDLKPDNIMLVPDSAAASGERIKLLDYGIAKLPPREGQSDGPLTHTNMVMGTPGYMAPEQLRDTSRATDRSDVYALGAVLFELLANRAPHVAETQADLLVRILCTDAPRLRVLRPEAQEALDILLARMLVREQPSERPTMQEVRRELQLIAGTGLFSAGASSGSVGQLASSAQSPAPSAATPSTLSRVTGQRVVRPVNARSMRQVGLALLVGTVLLASAVVTYRSVRTATAPPPLKVAPPPVAVPIPTEPVIKVKQDEPTLPTAQPPNEPKMPLSVTKKKPIKVPVIPIWQCVTGRGLTVLNRKDIAQAFSKMELPIYPGETLTLIRQGDGLILFDPPRRITPERQRFMNRMLAQFGAGELAPEVKRATVRCGGGAP